MKHKVSPSPLLFMMFDVFRKTDQKYLRPEEIVQSIIDSDALIREQCKTIITDALNCGILVLQKRKTGQMFRLSVPAIDILIIDIHSEFIRVVGKLLDAKNLKKKLI